MKYFSYSDDFGFELHSTREEAMRSVSVAIEEYRSEAQEGWPDGVDSVCWGVVNQVSVQSKSVEVTERVRGEVCVSPDVSHICDYGLEDAK